MKYSSNRNDRASGFNGSFNSFKILGVLTAVFVLSFSGCKKNQNSTSGGSSGSIVIGEVGSLTGSDATFGTSTHQAILMAFNEVNAAGGIQGRKLELVTLDDQGKASDAVLAINKLISQNHVAAVLGEVASTLSIAMAPIAQQSRVPMITPSSINSKVTQQGNYIFRVCFIDQFQSKVMADFALNQLHSKKVALLVDVKSDYSRDSAQIFADLFKKAGGQIVIEQSYSAGDVDFKSQLTAIRAAAPDLILVPGYYTEIGLIARQKKDLGITAPMLGGDAWDSPKLKEIGGAALDGSYFVGHFSQESTLPIVQKFIQNYKTNYHGETPDGIAALGYDAALILIDALKRAKSLNGPDLPDLREAIASTQNFQGVTGTITMGPDRNAQKAAVIFKLENGGRAKSIDLNAK